MKRFGLWDDAGEMRSVTELIEGDVRNNSAWNMRWFLRFGKEGDRFGERERVEGDVR